MGNGHSGQREETTTGELAGLEQPPGPGEGFPRVPELLTPSLLSRGRGEGVITAATTRGSVDAISGSTTRSTVDPITGDATRGSIGTISHK